jgi:hypothetical protein
VLALEHEEQLVLALVHVARCVERADLLDDREGAARRLGGGLDEHLGAAETEALAPRDVEPVRQGLVAMSANVVSGRTAVK